MAGRLTGQRTTGDGRTLPGASRLVQRLVFVQPEHQCESAATGGAESAEPCQECMPTVTSAFAVTRAQRESAQVVAPLAPSFWPILLCRPRRADAPLQGDDAEPASAAGAPIMEDDIVAASKGCDLKKNVHRRIKGREEP